MERERAALLSNLKSSDSPSIYDKKTHNNVSVFVDASPKAIIISAKNIDVPAPRSNCLTIQEHPEILYWNDRRYGIDPKLVFPHLSDQQTDPHNVIVRRVSEFVSFCCFLSHTRRTVQDEVHICTNRNEIPDIRFKDDYGNWMQESNGYLVVFKSKGSDPVVYGFIDVED